MMNTENFVKNRAALKKCEKFYNVAPIIYIVMGIFYLGFSFLVMISCSNEALISLFDGILISPLLCFLGLNGCYKKHDLSALGVPVMLGANCLLLYVLSKKITGTTYFGVAKFNLATFSMVVCLVMFAVSIPIGARNLKMNKIYHFLEVQVGFPYFNERAEQQRVDTIQRGIKDNFQKEYERRMRTATDSMIDLDIPGSDDTDEDKW